MTIELPREIEAQLKETAQAQGVSVGQYVERLVAETNASSRSHRPGQPRFCPPDDDSLR